MSVSIEQETYQLTLNYHIGHDKLHLTKCKLRFLFKIVDNRLQTKPPTLVDVEKAVADSVLSSVQYLAGQNVKFNEMILKDRRETHRIPLSSSCFGKANTKALPPNTGLYFALISKDKTKYYRFYFKGCASSFAESPQSEHDKQKLENFCELFTQVFYCGPEALQFQMIKNGNLLSSASFRQITIFKVRKITSGSKRLKKHNITALDPRLD